MNTYGRFPLALAKGKGCWVKDTQGRRYLDAVAGIATGIASAEILTRFTEPFDHNDYLFK